MSDHRSKYFRFTDIRALSELGFSGVHSITAIVEGVHQSVWRSIGIGKGEKTSGITGLIYSLIHGTTSILEAGINGTLKTLEPFFESQDEESSENRNTLLSVLNGVLGDQLSQNKNSLAIKMALSSEWNKESSKHVLFIHGLCMNDQDWKTDCFSYPDKLKADYNIHYLKYNSGRHISENGKEFNLLLEEFIAENKLDELDIIAHSMGGLITRSALNYGVNKNWMNTIKNVLFLGTPHLGAPLEKVGNWVDTLLSATMYSKPFAKIGQLRSAGITDLRHGYITEEDWKGKDRFQTNAEKAQIKKLPQHINCYLFGATMSDLQGNSMSDLIGDGLVPVKSAFASGHLEALGLVPENQYLFLNHNHIDLLHSEEVGDRLMKCLAI